MPKLAIVLITCNQAWNIERLIESTLRASVGIASQVAVIDSASTDQTVAVAGRFPVSIFRLRPDQHLSPAAGRFIGYKCTESEYVLFLDGDMELCTGWLEQALAVIEADSTIGIVTGQVIDIAPWSIMLGNTPGKSITGEVVDVMTCGGAAMCRRSALEQAGTFNPYLYSEEEPDVCVRVRRKGYRIVKLLRPMANHYTEPSDESISGLLSRRRRRFFLGVGQNVRYYAGTSLLWPYMKQRVFVFAPVLVLVTSLFPLIWSSTTRNWPLVAGWCTLAATVVAAAAYRKRSLYATVVSLVRCLFLIEGIIKGLLLRPSAPNTYSAKVDVIKQTL